jgi:hypothetical protein
MQSTHSILEREMHTTVCLKQIHREGTAPSTSALSAQCLASRLPVVVEDVQLISTTSKFFHGQNHIGLCSRINGRGGKYYPHPH